MARTREVHKKKIYHYDEDGKKNEDIWIEVERLDKLIIETGRGFHYQKTFYSFEWKDEKDDGTWEGSKDRAIVKRIKNPDDETQWVELPIIDKVTVETGRGVHYRKTVRRLYNTSENEARKTHKKTVYHTMEDKTKDKTQRLEVEVIDDITHETGRGFAYRKTKEYYEDQGHEVEDE